MTKRKWLIGLLSGFLLLLTCAGLVAHFWGPAFHSYIRNRTKAYLEAHFRSTLSFSDFDVSVYPRVRVTVTGVRLLHQGRTDIPPLFEIQMISFTADFFRLISPKPEIASVQLSGLHINLPPHNPNGKPLIKGTDQDLAGKYPIIIREITANDALLTILRKPEDAGKPPREFAIHHLVLKDFDFSNPSPFDAELTNPVPKGEIHCVGQFGPWSADDPRTTPVRAQYTFRDADMGTLKGLKGTLSSDGKFSGPLDYLNVQGTTDVPDFALRISDHPVHLHTDFSAIVDGTNGDVVLTRVAATLQKSNLLTKGEVVDMNKDVKGRTILMDTASRGARIEDFLFLAVKSNPPLMVGPVSLRAKIQIPEGDGDVLDRLKIQGQFDVSSAHFTSESVQGKVDSLSRRGQGHPKDWDDVNALSELKGAFTMDSGTIDFSRLNFSVPGASVMLAGNYQVDNGALNFKGHLQLKAKLSQTVTGVKSFFLKAVDPFFEGKNAGTDVPIKITGTKDHPAFGLDFHDKSNPKHK